MSTFSAIASFFQAQVFVGWSVYYLVDLLAGLQVVGWLVDRLLDGWLVYRLLDGWLVYLFHLVGWLVGLWDAGCLAGLWDVK